MASQPPKPPGKSTPPPPERRGTPRAPVDKAVEIRLLDDLNGQTVAAWLTNVSASGIAVRLSRPVARGREFVLLLPGNEAKALRYRVVRCQATKDGQFQIGAGFVRAPVATPKRALTAETPDEPTEGGTATAA